MSKMRRYFEEGAVYFVTTVTRERKPLFRDPRLCRILLVTIEYYKTIFDYLVLGYCLMPDHIHLILKPGPKFNLSVIMKMVKGSFSRKVNRLDDRRGSLWQSRYFEELIRSEKQLVAQLEYIHQNPLAAGLVSAVGDYLYSSFSQFEKNADVKNAVLEIDFLDFTNIHAD